MPGSLSMVEATALLRGFIPDLVAKGELPSNAVYVVTTKYEWEWGGYNTEVVIKDSPLEDGTLRDEPILTVDEVINAIQVLWTAGATFEKELRRGVKHNLDVNYEFPDTSPAWKDQGNQLHQAMKFPSRR